MWEKISDSSILFDKEYYNTNNFYSNSLFINRLYLYYFNKGYYNIITSQVINILISNFIIWFMIFLINVIDYKELINIKDYIFLNNILNWNNFLNLNYFMWSMVIIFILFTFIKILNLIDNCIKFYYVKYYINNNLKIKDNELEFIQWKTIIEKISESYNYNLNIYNINSIITKKTNYIISLFDKKIIVIDHLTNLMEWNIIYCILLKVLSNYKKNVKNNKNLFLGKKKIVDEIIILTRIISIVNFIFMPFILTIMIFYTIFNYGEEFYNNPNLLASRVFTKKALWKLRYYNELEHEFIQRINKVEKPSIKYTNSFTNHVLNNLYKLLLFICSSLFIVLIICSILNDKILIYVMITQNQSVLWFIGMLGTLIAFFRNNSSLNYPNKCMAEVCQHIYIEKDFAEKSYKNRNYKKFTSMYQYKLLNIIKEVIYTILVPFHLWIISYNINEIIDFINDHTVENNELNYVCVLSDFNSMINLDSNKNAYLDSISDQKYDSDLDLNSKLKSDIECPFRNNIKTKMSLEYFKNNYNEWEKKMHMKLYNINQSVQINVI
jgi:autophagy-related protein 9